MNVARLRDRLEVVSLTVGVLTILVLAVVYGNRWFDKTEAQGSTLSLHDQRISLVENRLNAIELRTETKLTKIQSDVEWLIKDRVESRGDR